MSWAAFDWSFDVTVAYRPYTAEALVRLQRAP